MARHLKRLGEDRSHSSILSSAIAGNVGNEHAHSFLDRTAAGDAGAEVKKAVQNQHTHAAAEYVFHQERRRRVNVFRHVQHRIDRINTIYHGSKAHGASMTCLPARVQ
jgi:hypothetical protein